jgi:hypothetical protein
MRNKRADLRRVDKRSAIHQLRCGRKDGGLRFAHPPYDAFIQIGLLAFALVLPATARAQTPAESQFQAFTASDFYRGLVGRAIGQIPPSIFQRCPTLVSNGSRVAVLKPIQFGSDGFPVDGIWRQSFPVTGCGNDTILNFYFFAMPEKKINTVVGVPGTSHADLTLQRDAVKFADLGATGALKSNCTEFNVRTTRFEAYGTANPPPPDPGPGTRLRPWWETWTMIGCGKIVDVPMGFVPDATGTRILQPGGATIR